MARRDLGDAIRDRCRDRNITDESVSLGLHNNLLGRWRDGVRPTKKDHQRILAEYLGVSLDELGVLIIRMEHRGEVLDWAGPDLLAGKAVPTESRSSQRRRAADEWAEELDNSLLRASEALEQALRLHRRSA